MPHSSAAARLENAPKPPAFLDPLFSLEDCYYYSVPTFFETSHPFTSWLLKRIIAGDVESLRRKLEFSSGSLCNRYFQLLDDPEIYLGDRPAGAPMFHNKCLLYLTPLGLCLYFKSLDTASLFLNFRTTTNAPVAHPDEAQFASHLQDTTAGDFHAFVPFIVLMRRQFFEASMPLQLNGWRPDKPFAMPLRRRYERRVVYCRDWLDAALGQISCRPAYPIAALVLCITANPLYNFSRLPIEAVKPQVAGRGDSVKGGDVGDDQLLYVRHGNLPIGDQPLSVPLVGVKNLLQLSEVYDQLLQTRRTAGEVRELIREASAAGLNTEILMMQAEECIAEDAGRTGENEANASNVAEAGPHRQQRRRRRRLMWRLNSNNHAKKKRQVPKSAEEVEHCSEPLRILLFSLTKDKSGTRLYQCLDAVGAYVRRNYFNCPQELPLEHSRSRDTRNVVTCLLNLISREQLAIDDIVSRVRSSDHRQRSLDTAKHLHTGAIAKVSALMTSVLMSSKQIVDFLSCKSFPPYPDKCVDFKVDVRAEAIMTFIRYGVVRDLNGCKDSWKYLTRDMLAEVVQDSAVLIHFKVGKRPTKAQMAECRRMLDRQLKDKDGRK